MPRCSCLPSPVVSVTPSMRYIISFVVASAITASGYWFCASTRSSLIKALLDKAKCSDAHDDCDRELIASLEHGEVLSGGYEIPSKLMKRLVIADLLAKWRLVIIFVVVAGCVSLAYAFKKP